MDRWVVVCRWWMLVELVSRTVVARSSGTRPAPSPAGRRSVASSLGRRLLAVLLYCADGALPSRAGRPDWRLSAGRAAVDREQRASVPGLHPSYRQAPASRHRAPSRRSIMWWPGDPSPVFNKTRLPATSRRNSRTAE